MSASGVNESSVKGHFSLVPLYSPGICPWVGWFVTMWEVWCCLCPTLPCSLQVPIWLHALITCKGSHARGRKSLVLISPERSDASLTTVHWSILTSACTISLTQLEHLGWHFKYSIFIIPLERNLATSKRRICIYPLN